MSNDRVGGVGGATSVRSRVPANVRSAFRSASRLGWGFADQALSSLTNFALGIIVARSVSTDDLGAFGLALVTYFTALGVGRAISSQPLVIRYSGVPQATWREGTAAAAGTMVLVGLASGIVSLIVGVLIGGALGSAFVALGLFLPGLLLQDCWRFAFIASGRGRSAFVNDLVWTVALFPALALVISSGRVGILWPMLAWGGAATIAAIIGVAQSQVVPRPARARWWLRSQRDLAARYAGEAVTSLGVRQVGSYLLATIGGLVVIGTLRAGDLLLSPLNVVFQGIHLIGIPEGVRALATSAARLVRFTIVLSGGLAAIVMMWGLVLWLLPHDVGQAILEESWEPARSVLVPLALSLALAGVSTGALIGLRVLAAAHRSLLITILNSIVALVIGIVGVILAGAQGVAWGIVIVSAFNVGLCWWQFREALADHRRSDAVLRDVDRLPGIAGISETDAATAPPG
jgi:O-antigen/teichoic acid export membrane protein